METIQINVTVKYITGAIMDDGKYYMIWDHATCKHICDLPIDDSSYEKIVKFLKEKNVSETPSNE